MEVEKEESIQSLKSKIESQEGIPFDQQRILFDGKQLDASKTIGDYNLGDESVLHLVLRLRGGLDHSIYLQKLRDLLKERFAKKQGVR